ncbi:hypothetical protein MY4824_003911 [Beauveria thailandica]
MEMLDEEHETLPQPRSDTNIYNLGAINNHNVVVAGLPKAGNCPAATVITQMRMTFPNLKHGLLVGIGGGVPVKTDHGMIRLGHVVVSEPTGAHSGAVQYDHGKATAGQFELKGILNSPPTALLNAAREVSVQRQRIDHDPIWKNTQRIDTSRPHLRRFKSPGVANDNLYQPDYEHRQADASCEDGGCDPKQRIERPMNDLNEAFVTVHRGTVASGELVIKDAIKRDNLARKLRVLCFEMEAAGASIDFPCMIIRGISDYCDSHKNDVWHGYAAAVAAAYARQLFFHMSIKEAAKSSDPTPHSLELSFDSTEISAVPYFVARQDELRQIHKLLRGPAGRLIAILYGLGGMGKTQLAMAYMKRHYSEYPVAIWLNARDEIALKQSFARAAERIQRLEPSLAYLKAALESRDLDEIWKAAKRWLEEPMNNRWMVIYDNYDDPRLDSSVIIGQPSHNNGTDPKTKFQGHEDAFDSKAFDIRPYLPTANHGSIIVTTRSSAVNFGPSIKIGKLKDANDSLEILAQTSRRKNLKEGHADRYMEFTINMEVGDETAWAFNSLGILYSNQGRLREAEAMFERALDGHDAWDPNQTSILGTVNNLGSLYSDQGRLEEAEATYKRALGGYEKACGPNHTSTLSIVNNLGILYSNQDRLQEAEAMYKRALDGYEKALRPNHTSTLSTVTNLGVLYRVQGRLQEAEAMYKRALDGYEKAWGPNHTITLGIVNNLGVLYWNQGRLREAEAMYKQALDGYEKEFGPDHTSTLTMVHNLGSLYSDQGRLQEAEALLKRALDGYEKACGPDHTWTLRIVDELGALYGGPRPASRGSGHT